MVKLGILEKYAIGGAVAAIFYIEPINTNDLDIFFHVQERSANLAVLAPLYDYLTKEGYESRGEAIEIEGWPVQFLPVFNELLEEAVEQAQEIRFKRTKTRIMLAEHLIAIMLQTGRLKDHARIAQFLEQGVIDEERLADILTRHGLIEKWKNLNLRDPK